MEWIVVITRVLKLGLDGWDAYCQEGLGSKELKAIHDALVAAGQARAATRKPAEVDAQHLGLMVAAFGRAFERHWVGTRSLERPGRLRRFFHRDERARDGDIQARLRMAGLVPPSVGDRAPGVEELAAVDSLLGSPLRTPYYQELWRVFSDPALVLEGEAPPLELDGAGRRAFERHFALAYWQAWNSPAGRPVRDWLASLGRHRTQVVRESLIADMSTWDDRHVFGNVARGQWNARQRLPFLPLGTMYVEPNAVHVREKGQEESEQPIQELLHALLEAPEPPFVAVVKADFGMGKSLTARTLVCALAQRYLADATTASPELWQPIFVRCADDMLGESSSLDQMVRRARKRHAQELGMSHDIDDPAFGLPGTDQRVLVVLDGLDEVLLGQQALEGLFQRLRDKATARCRILVMSRPGVLPEARHLKNVTLIELCRFRAQGPNGEPGGQVDAWLAAWNQACERAQPITARGLVARGLLELARTPILLFMIAHTWDEHAAQDSPSLARLYETFFLQLARGKHERDRDDHTPVYEAARRLRDALRERDELPEDAEPHEAMLWLLSRLAWKDRQHAWQHRIDRRMRGERGSDGESETLTRRQIAEVLHDELALPPEVSATVEIGIVLTLQADPTVGRDHIHFGHKSFREFLVARYWADRLGKLAQGRECDWDEHSGKLLGARLLLPEDRSFDFLMEIFAGTSERRKSPFAWSLALRDSVREWAQDCFDNEEQTFASAKSQRIQDDQRAVLREAALAIGSNLAVLDDRPGMKAKHPYALRSLLAWFWCTREPPRILAPKADLPGITAGGTYRQVDLRWANLEGAKCERSDFRDASFQNANLKFARLKMAIFFEANLKGANLEEADLWKANLMSANLEGANLEGANLGGTNLQGTSLIGARYNDDTSWPEDFDPEAAGAIKVE